MWPECEEVDAPTNKILIEGWEGRIRSPSTSMECTNDVATTAEGAEEDPSKLVSTTYILPRTSIPFAHVCLDLLTACFIKTADYLQVWIGCNKPEGSST